MKKQPAREEVKLESDFTSLVRRIEGTVKRAEIAAGESSVQDLAEALNIRVGRARSWVAETQEALNNMREIEVLSELLGKGMKRKQGKDNGEDDGSGGLEKELKSL